MARKKSKVTKTTDGNQSAVAQRVTTGKLNPEHTRIAKKAVGAGGMDRTAGMLIDSMNLGPTGYSTYKFDTYRTSYAYGLTDVVGAYDIPIYFMDMNQKNGGILYWPTSLHERYSWYRYFARSSPYVSRALDLLTDLPLSRLSLNLPRMPEGKEKLGREILDFFNYQLDHLNMFELFQNILYDYYVIGNVCIFFEYDEEKKMWDRAVILPPEETYCFQDPFTYHERVEYKPQRLIQLILSHDNDGRPIALDGTEGLDQEIVESVPEDIKKMVHERGAIVMDNDPLTGSFVHHIARRKFAYEDMGVSIMERILVPLLIKEHYKYTQLSLASRNMTPKNVIYAPGLTQDEVEELRTQVDLSYLDPEYSIVTNYEVNWQQIGAQDRLLDLSSETENLDNQIFAGLGVTREILTGEAQYSGTKINLEILNTTFMQVREMLKNMVEKKLFIPLCEFHGWYEKDANNIKHYYCPQVGFNRLTIRDNAEVFDSLFQLYQKGSLPISVIYELFNLDPDEMDRRLRDDLFTARDATFNRMVEEANTWVGQNIGENTDLMQRVAKYLKIKVKPKKEGDGGGEDDSLGGDEEGGGLPPEDAYVTPDFSKELSGQPTDAELEIAKNPEGDEKQQQESGQDTSQNAQVTSQPVGKSKSGLVDVDALAKIIADQIGKNATDDDINEAISAVESAGASGAISTADVAKIIADQLGRNATDEDIDEALAVVSEEVENGGGQKPKFTPEQAAKVLSETLPPGASDEDIDEGAEIISQVAEIEDFNSR